MDKRRRMAEAARAAGFSLVLLAMIAWGNWYVDSYGVFRVTYDKIAACLAAKRNIAGLTESKANERDLAAAFIKNPDTRPEYGIFGSSRVFMFEGQMMGKESFYNFGMSAANLYDIIGLMGALDSYDKIPGHVLLCLEASLFNRETVTSQYWNEYIDYWNGLTGRPCKNTGYHMEKWFSPNYFKYNMRLFFSEGNAARYHVSVSDNWDNDLSTKHYDGSLTYWSAYRYRNAERLAVADEVKQVLDSGIIQRIHNYDEFDETMKQDFENMIRKLQSKGIEVSFYLPPYQADIYQYISEHEEYAVVAQMEEYVLDTASEAGISVYGSYDPERIGLGMEDWYDPYHIVKEKVMSTFYLRQN